MTARPRDILAARNPEVWLITTCGAGGETAAGGMIATSVTSVSIVPDAPRVLVAISNRHHTHGLIAQVGRFALHLLGESNIPLVWQFGLASGRDAGKFAGVPTRTFSAGQASETAGVAVHAGKDAADAPRDAFLVVLSCLSWLGCEVETELSIGDRTLFVAAVTAGDLLRQDEAPLTMRRLAEVGDRARLEALRQQTARDAELDLLAIAAWRERQLLANE